MKKRWLSIIGTLVVVSLSTPICAAEKIGYTRKVYIQAWGTPPGESRHGLHARDDVHRDELIETVRDGWIKLRFLDKSQLKVSGGAQLILDDFVYDKHSKTGEMAVNITKGVMRFISGKMNSDGYSFTTPTALIGVRGTDIIIVVGRRGATQVFVLKGSVEVKALDSDEVQYVDRYKAVSINTSGEIDFVPYLPPANPGLDIKQGPMATIDGGGGGSSQGDGHGSEGGNY